ncbi:MAG: hypothetical protein AAF573_09555 [Bacteroidota bacterium]
MMKKQFIYILSLVWFCFGFCKAQDNPIRNHSLKIYSNFDLNTKDFPEIMIENPSGVHFQGISIAYQKNKKDSKKYFETELIYFQREQERNISEGFYDTITNVFIPNFYTYPMESSSFLLGIRAELGKWFYESKKIKLGIGGASQAFYSEQNIDPLTNETYPRERLQAGFVFSLLPKAQWLFHNRFYLELNLLMDVFTVGVDFQDIKNPALTRNQQKQGGLDFNQGGEVLLRLGIGYQF